MTRASAFSGETARRGVILLVEDEPLIAVCALATLEAAGHRVLAAATSTEALQLAELDPPDLALVDIQLANGRTGLGLTRELRQRFGTRCLLTTSHLAEDERGEHGAAALLLKPYTDRDLLTAVATCLAFADGALPPRRLPRQGRLSFFV